MPAKQPTVAGRINKLSQYCALFGNIVIYFENDKFLLQTIESDMYVLYSPPYDNLYYYSKRTKKLCVVPALIKTIECVMKSFDKTALIMWA